MPKNIILLSDGTGNSAAKLFKTNVWHLYESLDLTDPTVQVACYDDGIGTSSFTPLALLGGALGFGMKRNVLRLYRFLCEHYEPGDRIYGFGFSRGAFTIRVLTGLILDEGVIRVRPGPRSAEQESEEAVEADCEVINGGELRRYARWAYRRFRRLFDQAGVSIDIARSLRDSVFELRDRMRGFLPYEQVARVQVPTIEFLGLWDTVDAYGLPFDELTMGVDRWIWPLMMPDQRLSPRVNKACHALALDDERQTFHPVLWDEVDEPQDAVHTDRERITQVWFAGAHANVGGGYPNDALSYVSLDWMTAEAQNRQVRFIKDVLSLITSKRDVFGRVYDSRRGLASSYRYLPRPIERLTNGQVHEQGFMNRTWPTPSPTVTIKRAKIHESVFTRIHAAPEAYAPIGFPSSYAVVKPGGEIIEGPANPYEHPNQARWRVRAQQAAWNLVWCRRIVYFVSVVMGLLLAALPFRGGAAEVAEVAQLGGATRVVRFIGGFLPDFVSPWLDYYAARPVELVYLLTIIGVTTGISATIQRAINNRMREVWGQVMARPGSARTPKAVPLNWLARLRAHRYYEGAWAVFRLKMLPAAFAAGIVMLAVAALNRGAFETFNLRGGLCAPHDRLVDVPEGVVVTRTFATRHFCYASGLRLERGTRYRVVVGPYVGVRDNTIEVTNGAGFTFSSLTPELSLRQRAVFAVSAPFRRLWRANWFVPVARIGEAGVDQIPLFGDLNVVTPRNGGELFLFVNDAVAPLAPFPPFVGWNAYYANNRGQVTVRISKMAETPVMTQR